MSMTAAETRNVAMTGGISHTFYRWRVEIKKVAHSPLVCGNNGFIQLRIQLKRLRQHIILAGSALSGFT
jgi:hypothetical protein